MSKEITPENWLEPDGPMQYYVKVLPNGQIEPASVLDWLHLMLGPQLLPSVPQEVRDLFEGARGALIYGCFSYRLYFLGVTELQRVADAAVAHKYNQLNGPPSKRKFGPSFDDAIKWLAGEGVLQLAEWEWMPNARNVASHLKEAGIINPPMAIQVLEKITKMINALYQTQSQRLWQTLVTNGENEDVSHFTH
ncbi:MAG TPA: hypothetical protein VJ183_02940 [Chloroflexia bacterium]|nr:hypothetical protein [Chloroflexia bacterium]